VTVNVARGTPSYSRSARAGCCCSIAALLIFFGCESLQNATAEGETRTISFHHMHTDENLTVTYKVNGRYDEQALAKINYVLRDWREDQPIKMDPHVIDLLWEVHREVGAKEPIWVVCGYRSPSTNSMLRRHSGGVARYSQHMLGKAVDFYIPGVPLDQLRAAGLRAQRGGVGYYPTSGAPFVHLDTGSVRHWPQVPEAQLASVLSKGPLGSRFASDAKGRAVARAEVQGVRQPSFFAMLFGGGKDAHEEDSQAAAQATLAKATAPTRKPTSTPRSEKIATAAKSGRPDADRTASAKPVTAATESHRLASAGSAPDTEAAPTTSAPSQAAQARAAISANEIIKTRGYWQGLPNVEPPDAIGRGPTRAASSPRRPAAVATASPDSTTTASVSPWPIIDRSESEAAPNALAYASAAAPIAARAAIGLATPPATVAPPDTTIAVKNSDERPSATPAKARSTSVRVGDRFNDPWIRAMIVTPSAHSFMKTTLYGMPDFRNLRAHMHKPAAAVMMSFSDDPHLGITSEKFAGSAVVFMSTVTFSARTASLR
jgi:uncharacterized protein YcbK (DUF882 family)